jgi:hypothetical protein
VPSPHLTNVSNTRSEVDRECCVVRQGSLEPGGRVGAATRRNLGDSSGQQGIMNLEVSGRSQHLAWGAKPLNWAFTRQRSHALEMAPGSRGGRRHP